MERVQFDKPESWRPRFVDPDDPTYEECRALGNFFHLNHGKQCSHPCHTWFRDPRPSPPALRPPKTILAEILRDHSASIPSHNDAILANYVCPVVGDGETQNAAEEATESASFPYFTLLPPEIREQIWLFALPRRTLDLREARHARNYIGTRCVALPIPQVARVCRESRDVVLRHGERLVSVMRPFNKPSRTNVRPRARPALKPVSFPLGFFVKGVDVALHLPDPRIDIEEEPRVFEAAVEGAPCGDLDGPSKIYSVSGSSITASMKCEAAAVNWAGATRHLLADDRRRDPVSTFAPVNTAIASGGWLIPWRYLKSPAAGPALKTVYVFFRRRYIEVSLLLGPNFDPAGPDTNGTNRFFQTEIQLLVDLYDDQRLAELSSLESLFVDAKNNRPRFSDPGARNPGLCLNCERVQWEQHIRPLVLCQWLQMHQDELPDEAAIAAVFPRDDASSPYNVDHPWVKEKLRDAPEFRPAVLIHLQAVEKARLVQPGTDDQSWW
ncbi:hypothetical protein B0T24DRAFT_198376 [Lasiosphaeria ovina]|uniref:2EXR domain-containing protein n=1 Tax=Lasiosphaeria ovina TaxID=92902 RepID=A0AAE0NFQ5_9PEZI|nr:hypothetical protein B0T24DRAFT_198376 [Lasiosphaeria ovina]